MRKTLHLTTVAFVLVSLAGCGILFPNARDRAAKNTPSFKAGYSDGCASATVQGTNYRADLVRDQAAFGSDRNYRAGWGSGFSNCRTNSTQNPTAPGAGPIPDNSPGSHPY